MFQSHNGAIAAVYQLVTPIRGNIVSIPQWCDCCNENAAVAAQMLLEFQSHNGAIAASDGEIDGSAGRHKFQSHNGAIAASHQDMSCSTTQSVSIPQWCDCCSSPEELMANLTEFQSHNGAIAAAFGRQTTLHHSIVSIPQWCDCCAFVQTL